MVIKELYESWKKKGLIQQALDELHDMFKYDRQMYQEATAALFEGKKITMDIYKTDKEVNKFETNVRQKILQHLSITSCHDVSLSLLILGISRDIERIGDFCKNIYELSYIYKKPLKDGKYVAKLIDVAKKIDKMFHLAHEAIDEDNKEYAKSVENMHRNEIVSMLGSMIEDIANDKKIATKDAVVIALASRFLKRISAHLMGIASTVIDPFDRIRHRKSHLSLLDEKNIPAWKLKK